MQNKTTDEQIFSMPLKTFVPMILFIVLGTNTVSLTLQRLSNLEEKEQYNVEATKRRIENKAKETKYEYIIDQYKRDLEDCKNK